MRSSYKWIVLAAATVAQMTASFALQGLGVMAAFMQNEFGLSGFQTGLLITASAIGPLFGLLVVGNLLDRRSEGGIVATGALVVATALATASMVSRFDALLVCLVIAGIGYSTAQPGGSKSISAWFSGDQLGLAMGIRQAGLPAGGALASALLPTITVLMGWRIAFLLGAAVTLCGGLLFFRIYESPQGTGPATVRPPLSLLALQALLLRPAMRRAVWCGAGLIAVQYAILVHFTMTLRDLHQIDIFTGTRFLFAAQVCGVVGRIALAAWSDSTTRGRFFPVDASIVALLLGVSSLLVMPTESSASGFWILSAWLGFFGFGWYGPWVACVSEAAPAGSVGLSLGVTMTVNQMVIVVVPPLFGALHDWTGSYIPAWGAILLTLLAISRLGCPPEQRCETALPLSSCGGRPVPLEVV
jgi:MFS family permease